MSIHDLDYTYLCSFRIIIGLFTQSSPKEIIFLSHLKGYHKIQMLPSQRFPQKRIFCNKDTMFKVVLLLISAKWVELHFLKPKYFQNE